MTRKRLIASLLVAVLSAVQVAAWGIALERLAPAAARPSGMQSIEALLDTLLAAMPEPVLIALAGCLLIVIGIGVGMIGRKPVARPAQMILPLT